MNCRKLNALFGSTLTLCMFILCSSQAWALRVATYNIRNFDYDTRSSTPTDKVALAEIMTNLQADLIAVQEITKPDVFADFIKEHMPDHKVALTQCGGAHGQHLGFVYNQYKVQLLNLNEDERTTGVSKKQGNACPTEGSRPLAIGKFRDMEGKLGLFVAIAVHLKSGGDPKSQEKRRDQYGEIVKALDEMRGQGEKSLMVMGDFNSTEYAENEQGRSRFLQVFNQVKMEDLGEETVRCSNYYIKNGQGGKGAELTASVLDHILVNQEMMKKMKVTPAQAQAHCQVHQCQSMTAQDLGASYQGVSDHCPLLTEVK